MKKKGKKRKIKKETKIIRIIKKENIESKQDILKKIITLISTGTQKFLFIKIKIYINPLASPCAGAPALKYGDVNTETPSPGEVKGLNNLIQNIF